MIASRVPLLITALAALAVFAVTASAQATAADISTCKAVATAVGINPAGNTLFCPTNYAFNELADDLRISPAQLMSAVKANPQVFKTILSFHTVRGLLPLSAMRPGRTPVATLLGNGLNVVKDYKGEIDVEYVGAEIDRDHDGDDDDDNDDFDTKSSDVHGVDLTFDGHYTPGRSNYIVHAIDEVMVPSSVAGSLRRINGFGRKLRLL